MQFTTTNGDFTLGIGNLHGGTYANLFTYANRVYLAHGANWNFSSIDNPNNLLIVKVVWERTRRR
jgi:hypothetical protein